LSYTGLFALEHSIHKDDIHHLIVKIENPRNNFNEDVVWGSATFDMSVVESDRSITTDVLPATGTYRIGFSFLTKNKRNPHHVDMSIRENDRQDFRGMAKKGQILDRTKSSANQTLDFSKIVGSAADSVDLEEREGDFDSPPAKGKNRVEWTSNFVSDVHRYPAINTAEASITLSPRNPFRPEIEKETATQQVPILKSSLRSTMKSPPPSSSKLLGTDYPQAEPSISIPSFEKQSSVTMSPRNPFRTSSPSILPPSPLNIPTELTSSPVATPSVLLNRAAVKNSNLGTVGNRIQVMTTSQHPHIIATTEDVPKHSKLWEISNSPINLPSSSGF
jgi:hypothetical protein